MSISQNSISQCKMTIIIQNENVVICSEKNHGESATRSIEEKSIVGSETAYVGYGSTVEGSTKKQKRDYEDVQQRISKVPLHPGHAFHLISSWL